MEEGSVLPACTLPHRETSKNMTSCISLEFTLAFSRENQGLSACPVNGVSTLSLNLAVYVLHIVVSSVEWTKL